MDNFTFFDLSFTADILFLIRPNWNLGLSTSADQFTSFQACLTNSTEFIDNPEN
jgi:hypothetical protein